MSRRIPQALIRTLAVLALLAASVVPVAAASSSSPKVTFGVSIGGNEATVTVDVNRGTQQIASCVYILDDGDAVSCGAATDVGWKASEYALDLTEQSVGAHSVTVTIVLTDRGTADNAVTFTIVESDTDGDGVPNATDNCSTIANADQANTYGSAAGDACEDTDGNGTLDVSEPNICVSVDGVAILGPVGTATCESSKSTGASPNTAVADGDGADASAGTGNGNAATAVGDGASALTDNNGDHNTATATGVNAGAHAGFGSGNTATATGNGAFAAAIGNNNNATATGDGTSAFAQSDTGCITVNGSCS